MVKLKELMDFHKVVVFHVRKEDRKDFFEFVKEEGCIWRNGSIIKPSSDKKEEGTITVVVTSDLFIYEPVGWIAHMALNGKPQYRFEEIKDIENSEEAIQKSTRSEKIDQRTREAEEAEKERYLRKCEENRRLSKIQLKYKDITCKLQKNFFVRYENDDELFKLFLIFRNYGYENLYDIPIDRFNNGPKAICLDNEAMTFMPCSLFQCGTALAAGRKFYSYDVFEKIMKDIFMTV